MVTHFQRPHRHWTTLFLISGLAFLATPKLFAGELWAEMTDVQTKYNEQGNIVRLSAATVDSSGYVRRVEFREGTNLLGTVVPSFEAEPPPGTRLTYSVLWTNAPMGVYAVFARVIDASGNVFSSDTKQLTVTTYSNALPSITLHGSTNLSQASWPDGDYAPGIAGYSPYIQRVPLTDEPLAVFFEIEGTAVAGEDYLLSSNFVIIEPGEYGKTIDVEVIDDEVVEAPESLIIKIVPPPSDYNLPFSAAYKLPGTNRVFTIFDDDGTNARPYLELVSPRNPQLVSPSEPFEMKAIGADPTNYIKKVVFTRYGSVGEVEIGVSEPVWEEIPAPGTPTEHRVIWNNPVRATITARAYNALHQEVAVQRAEVGVGPYPDEVRLEVNRVYYSPPGEDAIERGTNGLPQAGAFLVQRTFGPTNQEVHFSYTIAGTAIEGTDYLPLPREGVLPAGVSFTKIFVTPIADSTSEGPETVILTLIDPQCSTTTNSHCYRLGLQPSGIVSINDWPPFTNSPSSLEIKSPVWGDIFVQGEPVTLSAEAVDHNGFISSVAFYASETEFSVSEADLISVSEVQIAPNKGTPTQHTVVWSNAPPGKHWITAQARDSRLRKVTSRAVRILVDDGTQVAEVSVRTLDGEAIRYFGRSSTNTAKFEFSRTGGEIGAELDITYDLAGTAVVHEDFWSVPRSLRFVPGQTNYVLEIIPADDQSIWDDWNMKTIKVTPKPGLFYRVSAQLDAASALLFREAIPTNAILDGVVIGAIAGRTILEVSTYHPSDPITGLQYLVGGRVIGTSSAATSEQFPNVVFHRFVWTNATEGWHEVTILPQSVPRWGYVPGVMQFWVQPDPNIPVVSVRYVDRAENEIWANADYAPGYFQFRRERGLDSKLAVSYSASGTATAGSDYVALPGVVLFSEGEATSNMRVVALPDDAVDPNEQVRVTLMPPTQPYEGYNTNYIINLTNLTASLLILDGNGSNNPPGTQLNQPTGGSSYGQTEWFTIAAAAWDHDGTVANLQILIDGVVASETNRGALQIWTNLPPGAHTLAARVYDNRGTIGDSMPIQIQVRGTNTPAGVRITHPGNRSFGAHLLLSNGLGHRCTLESSTNLKDWQVIGELILVSDSTPYEVPNTHPEMLNYYRLRLQ